TRGSASTAPESGSEFWLRPDRAGRAVEQAEGRSARDRLHARVDIELLEEPASVGARGLVADAEALGDLAHRVAVGDQLEDLALAGGERAEGGLAALFLAGERDKADERCEAGARAEPRLGERGDPRLDAAAASALDQRGAVGFEEIAREIEVSAGDGEHDRF